MRNYIYVVFSSTPYKMGKFIRRMTREKYNHVAVSLDPRLGTLYSFARKYVNTPFYGGFIKESWGRYRYKNHCSEIMVCAIPVTYEQYEYIKIRLAEMCDNESDYLYNMWSAFMVPLRKRVNITDAYTCTEFAASILGESGVFPDLSSRKFCSLSDLLKLCRCYITYKGIFSGPDFEESGESPRLAKNIAVRTKLTVSANTSLVKKYFKTKNN